MTRPSTHTHHGTPSSPPAVVSASGLVDAELVGSVLVVSEVEVLSDVAEVDEVELLRCRRADLPVERLEDLGHEVPRRPGIEAVAVVLPQPRPTAGPLLGRLHKLTRSDCTTRNQRRARRLSRAYDDLEVRIERLLEREELGKVRPELDGHEIAEVLGIEPGPALGQAYKHLLSVRLDEGVIGKAEAAQRLREWWAERDATG